MPTGVSPACFTRSERVRNPVKELAGDAAAPSCQARHSLSDVSSAPARVLLRMRISRPRREIEPCALPGLFADNGTARRVRRGTAVPCPYEPARSTGDLAWRLLLKAHAVSASLRDGLVCHALRLPQIMCVVLLRCRSAARCIRVEIGTRRLASSPPPARAQLVLEARLLPGVPSLRFAKHPCSEAEWAGMRAKGERGGG